LINSAPLGSFEIQSPLAKRRQTEVRRTFIYADTFNSVGALDAGCSGVCLGELEVRAFLAPARSQRARERSIRRFIQRFIVVDLLI
jgi:hypothetical protein